LTEGGANAGGSIGWKRVSLGSRGRGPRRCRLGEGARRPRSSTPEEEDESERWLEGHIPAISVEKPRSPRPCMKV